MDSADRVAADMRDRPSSEVTSFYSNLQQYIHALPGLADGVLCGQASWLAWPAGDRNAARSLLEPLHTRELETFQYAPLLQVYLDLCREDLPVTRQLEVTKHIITLLKRDVCPNEAELLHYHIVHGIDSLMLGDYQTATAVIDFAIKEYLPKVESDKDVFGLKAAAMAHEVVWRLRADPVELGKTIELLNAMLKLDLTEAGFELIHRALGIVLLESGAFVEAIEHLEAAERDPGMLVNLARAFARLGRIDDAKSALAEVNRNSISEPSKLEFLGVDAMVAVASNDQVGVSSLIDRAKELELRDLYFQRSRDQLCISLLEFTASSRSAKATNERVSGIMGWLRYVSQFLELKPNVMGFGINVNRIIEGDPQKK
jgi:hypothetical protein